MLKIAFSGHRPNKLGGYNWNNEKNKRIITKINSVLTDIMKENNYFEDGVHFIFGGALGIDQMAYHVCRMLGIRHELRLKNKLIMEVAVPYKNQPNKWFNNVDVIRYNKQLEHANIVTYVDELEGYSRTNAPVGEYNAYKLQIRNEYMIDNCDLLIAVWDGSKGGTCNCIKYAEKLGKKIIIIDPSEI